MSRVLQLLLLAMLATAPIGDALADEAVTARVILIEPTYMPTTIMFQLDKPLPSCPLGTWLRWNKGAENNKAAFASLLSALTSGKPVRFHINSGDTTCAGQYLHFESDGSS